MQLYLVTEKDKRIFLKKISFSLKLELISLLSMFLFLSFLIVLILATLILAKLVKLHNTQLAQERTIKVFLKTKLIDKLDTWDCEAG